MRKESVQFLKKSKCTINRLNFTHNRFPYRLHLHPPVTEGHLQSPVEPEAWTWCFQRELWSECQTSLHRAKPDSHPSAPHSHFHSQIAKRRVNYQYLWLLIRVARLTCRNNYKNNELFTGISGQKSRAIACLKATDSNTIMVYYDSLSGR